MTDSGEELGASGEAKKAAEWRRSVIAIAAGLALGLLTMFLALLIAGAGHGWSSPMLFSLPLAVLYPAAFLLATLRSALTRRTGVGLVALGLILDLALALQTSGEESEYFLRILDQDLGPEVVTAWIFLWLGWQATAFVAAWRNEEYAA
jgi:hypothetical protein